MWCFAILRQLQCTRRSVVRTVLQSLVSSLVLSRLDYGNATLAGIPGHLVQRLQSVMNAVARMKFPTSRYNHITPFLRQLRWLTARERIDYKLAVLVYKCLHGTGPAYLANELSHSSDFVNRRKCYSASSLNLILRRTIGSLHVVIERLRLPAPVSRTVFHLTSLLRRQSIF